MAKQQAQPKLVEEPRSRVFVFVEHDNSGKYRPGTVYEVMGETVGAELLEIKVSGNGKLLRFNGEIAVDDDIYRMCRNVGVQSYLQRWDDGTEKLIYLPRRFYSIDEAQRVRALQELNDPEIRDFIKRMVNE